MHSTSAIDFESNGDTFMTEPSPPGDAVPALARTPWEHLADVFGPDPVNADQPSHEFDIALQVTE